MACLTALKASPTKLIIELTESWNMAELGLAETLLSELKTRGHPVCLDDVGAGAASIRYLRALPCNWLKIDGGFVAAAFNTARDRAISGTGTANFITETQQNRVKTALQSRGPPSSRPARSIFTGSETRRRRTASRGCICAAAAPQRRANPTPSAILYHA